MRRHLLLPLEFLRRIPGKFWLLILSPVLLLLVLNIAFPFFTFSKHKVIYPDGSYTELAKVTYGKEHVFETQSRFQKLLAAVPPYFRMLFRLPVPTQNHVYKSYTTNDAIGFWFYEYRINPKDFPAEITLLDAGGRISREADTGHSGGVSTNIGVQGHIFHAFPRRSRTVTVQLSKHDTNGQRLCVAEFRVPNPARKWFVPKWKPDPLPITRRDGDLEFTLTKLVSGLEFNGRFSLVTNRCYFSTLAMFRVTQDGLTLTNWRPTRIFHYDSSGNEAQNRTWSPHSEKNGELGMIYEWGLDPAESAWKMRIEFSRISGFTPAETWNVNNISTNVFLHLNYWGDLPATNMLARTNISGHTLEIAGVCERKDWNGRVVTLKMRVQPPAPTHRITLVGATDEHGRNLHCRSSSWGESLSEFDLVGLEQSKSLNVTVAFHQNRYVEYLAKPVMARLGAYPLTNRPPRSTAQGAP